MISSFSGPYRFLSNFYPVQIVDPTDGLIFPSVEHAYQAAKTTDAKWRGAIRTCGSSGLAKAFGKRVPLRPDWDAVKLGIMEGFLREKFSGPALRRALLLTGDEQLVEGNTWGDTYWGVCKGTGENHLGRLLMLIRADLRAQTS